MAGLIGGGRMSSLMHGSLLQTIADCEQGLLRRGKYHVGHSHLLKEKHSSLRANRGGRSKGICCQDLHISGPKSERHEPPNRHGSRADAVLSPVIPTTNKVALCTLVFFDFPFHVLSFWRS